MQKKYLVNYSLWLIFCVAGGALGAWLYDYSIDRYLGNVAGSSSLSRYDQSAPVIIRDAKNVVVEQNVKIIDTITASESFLMGVFKKNVVGKYDLTKPDAEALTLTSDGWLMTDLAGSGKEWQNDYVVIDKDGKVFGVDSSLDDAGGLTFVHLNNARGLVVADFMKAKDLRRGQPVIVSAWLGSATQDSISKIDLNPAAVKSSDQPYKQLLLATERLDAKALVALDIGGKVAGFFNRDRQLLATDYFIYKISSLLAGNKKTIPVLGVNYVNLSWQADSSLVGRGALLIKNDKLPAVLKGSPAESAGLKEGDVILSLDNAVITRDLDLSDLLSDYRPQDKVIVKYLRDKQEKSVEVTLGAK